MDKSKTNCFVCSSNSSDTNIDQKYPSVSNETWTDAAKQLPNTAESPEPEWMYPDSDTVEIPPGPASSPEPFDARSCDYPNTSDHWLSADYIEYSECGSPEFPDSREDSFINVVSPDPVEHRRNRSRRIMTPETLVRELKTLERESVAGFLPNCARMLDFSESERSSTPHHLERSSTPNHLERYESPEPEGYYPEDGYYQEFHQFEEQNFGEFPHQFRYSSPEPDEQIPRYRFPISRFPNENLGEPGPSNAILSFYPVYDDYSEFFPRQNIATPQESVANLDTFYRYFENERNDARTPEANWRVSFVTERPERPICPVIKFLKPDSEYPENNTEDKDQQWRIPIMETSISTKSNISSEATDTASETSDYINPFYPNWVPAAATDLPLDLAFPKTLDSTFRTLQISDSQNLRRVRQLGTLVAPPSSPVPDLEAEEDLEEYPRTSSPGFRCPEINIATTPCEIYQYNNFRVTLQDASFRLRVRGTAHMNENFVSGHLNMPEIDHSYSYEMPVNTCFVNFLLNGLPPLICIHHYDPNNPGQICNCVPVCNCRADVGLNQNLSCDTTDSSCEQCFDIKRDPYCIYTD